MRARIPTTNARSVLIGCVTLAIAGAAYGDAWPGGAPVDVTPADFGHDVSGAVWNPVTARLWTCENNPGVVRRSRLDAGAWIVEQSWQIGDDVEAIAIAGWSDATVFVGIERFNGNHRLIREYDVSGTTPVLLRQWDLAAMQFGPDNDGLEALTFVPDASLAAMNFIDMHGMPYPSSQGGAGGLFFAGHQINGDIYVFDLDRQSTGTGLANAHVATIDTGQNEIAGLEFDRSAGLLYAWHDASINRLQVFGSDGAGRFVARALYDNPFCCDWSIEGIALADSSECAGHTRSLLFTRDQSGSNDPSLYADAAFPCDCAPDFDCDEDVDVADFAVFAACFSGANLPPAATCAPGVRADLDLDGDVDLADFALFVQAFTGA